MLKELKLAIIERLNDKMGDRLEITNHPTRKQGDVRGLPRATVAYTSSTFGPPQGSGTGQERSIQISVFVETEDLYDDDETLDLMDDIQGYLTGWQPPGDQFFEIRPASDQPIVDSKANQIYARELRFTVPAIHNFQRRYK